MRLLHPSPLLHDQILGAVRIILGLLLVYHGQEIFHPDIMDMYRSWDVFQHAGGPLLVFIGKCAELTSGILLTLGLLTRLGALLCAGTLAFVTFVVGGGEVWYADQHPFMFVLFGLLFFFLGPGAWSLDAKLYSPGKDYE